MTLSSPAEKVSILVPCRTWSKRVPEKNTRPYAGNPEGLIGLKLRQLIAVDAIDDIVVSTDDERVIEIAERYAQKAPGKVRIVARPVSLASDDVLDAFIAHIPEIIPEGHIGWTHVTSPFFGADSMSRAIDAYAREVENGPHDSLMSVVSFQDFLWKDGKCISHDRSKKLWPRSQDLPVFSTPSGGLFMISRDRMLEHGDRIGSNPYLLDTGKIEAVDIDWPDDFKFAEMIATHFVPNSDL